jgi:hypothetical protein
MVQIRLASNLKDLRVFERPAHGTIIVFELPDISRLLVWTVVITKCATRETLNFRPGWTNKS